MIYEILEKTRLVANGSDTLAATDKSARYWEIDALRGFAIVEMVIYHFIWDLVFFGLFQANLLTGPHGQVIALVNWSEQAVKGLELTIDAPAVGAAGPPRATARRTWWSSRPTRPRRPTWRAARGRWPSPRG